MTDYYEDIEMQYQNLETMSPRIIILLPMNDDAAPIVDIKPDVTEDEDIFYDW